MKTSKEKDTSRWYRFFEESVFQRSDTFDANKIASDPNWNLDRAELVEACKEMRVSELAPALLYAIFHGDVTFAGYLWRERGPFRAHLKHTGPGQFELNDKPYNIPADRIDLFAGVRNVDQLKAMIDLIAKTEVIGLLDGAGALFMYGQQHTVVSIARSIEFEGELPVLKGEFLSSPELMLTLIGESRGSKYRKSYDPILCWATPEMVKTYGDFLDPYVPVHGAKVAGEQMGFEAWRLAHEKAVAEGAIPPQCDGLTLACMATRDDERGQIVMQALGSKKLKHGIFEKEGLVLCHTSCRFLAEFERPTELDSQNYGAAKLFTERFVPLDMLTRHAHPNGKLGWPTENGFNRVNGGKELAFMKLGEDIHQALGPVLSSAQWKFILRGDWLKGPDILTAVKQFGLDNGGMIWKMDQETPGDLRALGYKFVPGTEVFLQDKKGETIWDRRNTDTTCVDISDIKTFCKRKDLSEYGVTWGKAMLEDTYELGLWPFKEARPELSDGIASLARKKSPMTDLSDAASMARITIRSAPVEECIKHAKQAKEWSLLAEIHGAEAMKPFVTEMPMQSRGRVFALELGV